AGESAGHGLSIYVASSPFPVACSPFQLCGLAPAGLSCRAMTGQLGLFSLVDLLQLLASKKRSGLLAVEHPRGQGRLFLKGGDVVHAEFDSHTGRNAVYALLADEQGSYEFTDEIQAPRRSIDVSSEDLLLDAIRRTDASRGRTRSLRETYIGDAVPALS